MINKYLTKILLKTKKITFDNTKDHWRPGSLRIPTNFFYIIFEKISYSFDFLSRNYNNLYNEVVKKEIKLSNLKPDDKILVIGCGTIPSTAIILSKKINSKIVAIDIDSKAVFKATKFIEKHKLDDKIKIASGNGLNYPIKNFDVIFISYGVKYYNKILKNLSENINQKQKIVYRSNEFDKNKSVKLELSKLFTVKNFIKTDTFGIMISFLLEKKV